MDPFKKVKEYLLNANLSLTAEEEKILDALIYCHYLHEAETNEIVFIEKLKSRNGLTDKNAELYFVYSKGVLQSPRRTSSH